MWSLCERIFSVLQTFIHPMNDGKWTSGILRFYRGFCSRYLRRYYIEQKEIMKQEKTNENNMEVEEEVEEEFTEDQGSQEDQMDKGGSASDSEDEDDEETSESDISKSDEKIRLDEECHSKFLEIMMSAIKNIVFLKEQGDRTISLISQVYNS